MTRSVYMHLVILSSCHLVTAAKRDVLQPQLLFGIHFAVVVGLKLGGLACSTPLQHRARAQYRFGALQPSKLGPRQLNVVLEAQQRADNPRIRSCFRWAI